MLMNILSCRYLANVCISDYFVFSVYNRSITFHYNFSWLCYSIESSSVIIIIDGILFSFAHMRFSMIFLIVFVFLVLKLISFVEHWKKKSKIIQPKTKKKKTTETEKTSNTEVEKKHTHREFIHWHAKQSVRFVLRKQKAEKQRIRWKKRKKEPIFVLNCWCYWCHRCHCCFILIYMIAIATDPCLCSKQHANMAQNTQWQSVSVFCFPFTRLVLHCTCSHQFNLHNVFEPSKICMWFYLKR